MVILATNVLTKKTSWEKVGGGKNPTIHTNLNNTPKSKLKVTFLHSTINDKYFVSTVNNHNYYNKTNKIHVKIPSFFNFLYNLKYT